MLTRATCAAGDLRRRARELAALHQMAARLSSAASAEALVSTILDGARHVMSCDSAALYLFEPPSEDAERLASRGFTAEERQALDHQAAGLVRTKTRPRWGRPVINEAGSSAVEGILWAPLVVDGQTIGALCLGGRQPGGLGPGDYGLATAIADYAAIAIANVRLLRSNESNVRNLSTLGRVGQAVAESLQSQLVLQEIVRAAAEALTPSSTTVSLLNEQRTEVVVAAVHLSTPAEDFRRRMPLHDSLAGWIIAHGEPLVVPSPATPTIAQISASSQSFGIASGAGAPIVVQGETIGAVTAYSTTQRRYRPGDVDLLQALAAQAAIAIEQARLHRSAMQDKAKLEAIVESLQEGLVLVDMQGRIAYAEPALRRACRPGHR